MIAMQLGTVILCMWILLVNVVCLNDAGIEELRAVWAEQMSSPSQSHDLK